MPEQGLRGAVALVTGASRGIGAAIASELGRQGAHVIALARDQTKLRHLEQELGGSCTGVVCDLNSSAALAQLRGEVERRWGRLDVLVGNAAIMGPRTTLATLEDQDWANVFETNVAANWRLIRTFDHLLRAAPHGRAVFMTSGAGSRARMGAARGAYAISKAALDALVRTYASETDGSDLRVMLCNPGPIRTSLRAQAAPDEDPLSLRTPAEVAPKIAVMCLPSWRESGRLYDFPTDRLLDFKGPA
jgi:NAD(P)-dependent dehydrogenase (short-subunit alcohol dehydrogenase family)